MNGIHNENKELSLSCNTARNQGYLSNAHYLKLRGLLESCIDLYEKPCILHYRISFVGHEDRLPDVSSYLQNRFNRIGLQVSWVKATEDKEDSSYLHQHLFLIVNTKHKNLSPLEVIDEIHESFWGLKNNGYIYSFRRNNKKIHGAYGTDWADYETVWFPLSLLTLDEALVWCSYAIKRRSKCVEGRARVTWSMPRPAGQRSRKGRPPVQTTKAAVINARVFYGYGYSSTANIASRFNRVVYA